MPKIKLRLKKGPDIQNYVVERIDYPNTDAQRVQYSYFKTRAEARDLVKTARHDRVRLFRIRYELISDTGAKRGRK